MSDTREVYGNNLSGHLRADNFLLLKYFLVSGSARMCIVVVTLAGSLRADKKVNKKLFHIF